MKKENTMKEVAEKITLTVLATLCFAETIAAQVVSPITPLPRDLEIALALSALPPHLRDNATVYVFNVKKGFEPARQGTNGLHAFVGRQDNNLHLGSWELSEYRDDILIPISFDSAGAKTIMPVWFDVAKELAAGTPPGQLKTLIKERFEQGRYKSPARAGVSYMLSPILRGYVNPLRGSELMTLNVPHYMFYAPHIASEDFGGGPFGGPQPFVQNHGAHAYIVKGVGTAEKAAINSEYADMLKKLCEFKREFCLTQ